MITELLLNWKMNIPDTRFDDYMTTIVRCISKPDSSLKRVHISCPSPYLKTLACYSSDKLRIGSQDVHFESAGAYSGGVSAQILADCGASFTLVGHSETRDGLSQEQVKQKIKNALLSNLDVYFCFGEQIQDVKNRMVLINEQLDPLREFVEKHTSKIKLCYEPVWSIGTGIIPSVNDVQSVIEEYKIIECVPSTANFLRWLCHA